MIFQKLFWKMVKSCNVCQYQNLHMHPRNWLSTPANDIDVVKMDRVKRIWYLSPMRAAKVQASLRIRAVSPEPSLLAHTSSESRGIFRQKTRSLAPLNGWACAVKICHDGMLVDTNSLDGAQMMSADGCQNWQSKVLQEYCLTSHFPA